MKNFFKLIFLLPIAVVLGVILMGDPAFDEVRVEEWVEEQEGSVTHDDDDVTHGVFFGENFKRLKKLWRY